MILSFQEPVSFHLWRSMEKKMNEIMLFYQNISGSYSSLVKTLYNLYAILLNILLCSIKIFYDLNS